MKLEMKLRLEKYGYKNCINCSTTETYKAVITTNGEGDHTWNDIQILTDKQYKEYNQGGDKKTNKLEDLSEDDSDLQEFSTIITP